MNYPDFSITFSNPNDLSDTFNLDFVCTGTAISRKWLKQLYLNVKEGIKPGQKRFYNFVTNGWTEQRFVEELNKCIAICNSKYPGLIDFVIEGKLTQEQHNILHTYFEKYRGPITDPHPFFVNGSDEYRSAMEDLNLLIHRQESFHSDQVHNTRNRRIIFEFYPNRVSLSKSDYVDCQYHKRFGEIALKYCEVGKPLYDVFKDGDQVVGENNIKPQRYYNSDFCLYLPELDPSENTINKWNADFNQWYDNNDNWFKSINLDKNDPAVMAGQITVAKLVSDFDRITIINNVETRQNIKNIEVYW